MSSNVATTWTATHGKLLLAVAIDPKEVGRRIQAARKARRLTQLTMALELNVSPSAVAKWEAGKLPPVTELIRVAEHLEIDPGTLVETPDEEEQASLESVRKDARAAHREATRARAETQRTGEKLDLLLQHFGVGQGHDPEQQEPPESQADTP